MAAMSLNRIYMLTDILGDTLSGTGLTLCEVVEEERGQKDKLPGG